MFEIEREKLAKQIAELEEEHKELGSLLNELIANPENQLKIQRLKKRKLLVKDKINLLKAQFYQDIIA